MVEVRNTQFWFNNVKKRDILGDLVINETILLKVKKNIYIWGSDMDSIGAGSKGREITKLLIL
jgi:hypothetical protein